MISVAGKRQDEKDLEKTLTSGYNLFVRVRLLDLNGNYNKDLTPQFLDGSVTVDADADVTRGLDLTLLDPEGKIHVDPDSPASTSIFIADMISVVYVVQKPDRSQLWAIPVFCGPINAVSRDDTTVVIKAVGKESLAMTNLWRGRHFKKNQEKTWVIRQILTDMIGETKIHVPNRNAQMPNDRKLGKDDAPWKVAKDIAHSMGMQLFYDGRGVATMRPKGGNAVLTLDGAWLSGEPQVDYDLSAVINAVRVIGGKPKKAKHPVKGVAVAQKSHPLSPYRLGRNGAPRYLWVEIQDDSLRTNKECKDLAKKTLRRGLLGGVTIAVDGIAQPRLQELDVIRIRTDNVTVTLPLRRFTIPLIGSNWASYGYNKSLRPRGGFRRRHKRAHHGAGVS